jgi:hypothetical protein
LLHLHSNSTHVLETHWQATHDKRQPLPGKKIQIRFEVFMANKCSKIFSGKNLYQNWFKTNTSETCPSLTTRSSGMWCHWTNGSWCLGDCSVFAVRVKWLRRVMKKIAWPWRWGHYVHLKHQQPFTQQHSTVLQKTTIFSNTIMRTSNTMLILSSQRNKKITCFIIAPNHTIS